MKEQKMSGNVISDARIERRIFVFRGHKVILDWDLAELYGVSTKRLNEQVKRNIQRFPADFMFQLTSEEYNQLMDVCENLRSQNATSKRGGRRYHPYAFTEQGVAMLSSVLNSENAIQVNIQIMRSFTKLRELMITHKDLAYKIDALERQYKEHDDNFKIVFKAIRRLLEEPVKPKKQIGFHSVR